MREGYGGRFAGPYSVADNMEMEGVLVRRALVVLLMMAVLLPAGCARQKPTEEEPGPVDGGTLRLALERAPRGLFHPLLSEDPYDERINRLIYSGLLRTDESWQMVCDLCRSFTVGEERRSLRFDLREDVRWHDGQPLSAEDVAFTLRALLHPDAHSGRGAGLAALAGVQRMLDQRDYITRQAAARKLTDAEAAAQRAAAWQAWLEGEGAAAIQVTGPLSLTLTLDQPYAPLLVHLAHPVLPAHIYGGLTPAEMEAHEAVRHPVGTGPFRFVSYTPGRRVELQRNEAYHGGRPHVQSLLVRVAATAEAVAALAAGELDAVRLEPQEAEVLAGLNGVQVLARPSQGYQYMGLNVEHPALQDRRLRQALMHGLDRQALIEQVLGGHGTVIQTHLLPGHWAYPQSGLTAYDHDPERAGALLAEAGWTQRNADGYLTRGGQELSFTLLYPAGNAFRERTAPLIAAQLKAIGVRVELQQMEFGALARAVFTDRKADAWLLGWDLGIDPDPGPVFLSNNKWGRATGWSHARSEELTREAVQRWSPAERRTLYAEWAAILNQELPYLFLYAPHQIEAYHSDRIRGLQPAAGDLWSQVHRLWIPRAKQGQKTTF